MKCQISWHVDKLWLIVDVPQITCTQNLSKTSLICRLPKVSNIKNRSVWTNILDPNRIEEIKLSMIRHTYKIHKHAGAQRQVGV